MTNDVVSVSVAPAAPVEKRPYVFKRFVRLFGCPVAALTLEETIQEIHKMIAAGGPYQHCVLNAGKIVLMHRDPNLKKIVHSCALINADGQSVVWALKLIGRTIPERVTGIDLMERLFVEADKRLYRVFFLGASQNVLDKVLAHVGKNFPGLVVAGSHDGYFADGEDQRIVDLVSSSRADILFVAMGSPKKEYWMASHISKLKVPFCMGVGGSFDVVAGRAKRAPRWIQNVGMEWFFRFIQEPRRLWRRYVWDNFVFLYLLTVHYFEVKANLEEKTSAELSEQEIT